MPSPNLRSTTAVALLSAAFVLLFVGATGKWLGAQTPASRPGATNPLAGPGQLPTNTADNGTAAPQALPAATVREMEAIEAEVMALRGLRPRQEVRRALISPEGLRNTIQEDFLRDYSLEEALADTLVLTILGLIPPDFNLLGFYEKLLNEQIVGYYDQETKELYVVRGRGFRGPERMVYAHEYTHALQDQNYQLGEVLAYTDERCDQDTEGCAALRALFEGDAGLTELNWLLTHATPREELEVRRSYQEISTPVLDSAPAFLSQDFTFPYYHGFEFVRQLYGRGGLEAVNPAYLDPPVSTEQILHPERYPDDQPEAVSLPDLTQSLGAGWELIEQGVLGEWRTYLTLAQGVDPAGRVSEALASAAAEGWAGDRMHVYYLPDSGQVALVLRTDWESVSEAQEFAAAFRQYARGRFPSTRRVGDGSLVRDEETLAGEFDWNGEETIWVMAPQADLADALLKELAW